MNKSAMRICVLGNSHVASLKKGWDLIKDRYENIDLTFFAQRQRGLIDLEIKDGMLFPSTISLKNAISYTSGGRDHIDFSLYDSCLIYGLGLKPYKASPDQFFSENVLSFALKDHISKTVSLRTLLKIKKVSSITTYVGHQPLLAAQEENDIGDLRLYFEGFELLKQYFNKEYGCNLVSQPSNTICGGFNTMQVFSSQSTRLDIGDGISGEEHPVNDVEHMNDLFGAKYLEEFFKLL